VAALCRQSFGGVPPEKSGAGDEVRAAYERALPEWRAAMEAFAWNRALETLWRYLTEINGHIVAREPWKVRKEEGASPRLSHILYAAAEGVRLFAVLLSPFLPATSRKIFETFGRPPRDPLAADLEWGGLVPGTPLPESPALFPRADAAAYLGEKEQTMSDSQTPPAPPTPPAAAAASSPAPPPSDGRIGIEEFQKVH